MPIALRWAIERSNEQNELQINVKKNRYQLSNAAPLFCKHWFLETINIWVECAKNKRIIKILSEFNTKINKNNG